MRIFCCSCGIYWSRKRSFIMFKSFFKRIGTKGGCKSCWKHNSFFKNKKWSRKKIIRKHDNTNKRKRNNDSWSLCWLNFGCCSNIGIKSTSIYIWMNPNMSNRNYYSDHHWDFFHCNCFQKRKINFNIKMNMIRNIFIKIY